MASGMDGGTGDGVDPEAYQEFWAWFVENGDRIASELYADEVPPDLVAKLMTELNDRSPGPTLEVTKSDAGFGLIVSADGKHDRLDVVKEMVACAPQVDGWTVNAFRGRIENVSIEVAGESIGPEDIRFQWSRGSHGANVTLFVKGMTKANQQQRGFGAQMLAHHAMGELNSMTLIESMEVRKPPFLRFLWKAHDFERLGDEMEGLGAAMFPEPGKLVIQDRWSAMEGNHLGDPVIVLLSQGIHPYAGHPQYDLAFHVTVTFASKDEAETAMDRTDAVRDLVEQGQEAFATHTVTCLPKGRRTMVIYSSNPEGTREKLTRAASDQAAIPIEWTEQFDSMWIHYRQFANHEEHDHE